MHVPTGVPSRVEVVTGLVAAGAGFVVVVEGEAQGRCTPAVGHPMVPVLRVAADSDAFEETQNTVAGRCFDLRLGRRVGEDERARGLRWLRAVVALLSDAVSGHLQPH